MKTDPGPVPPSATAASTTDLAITRTILAAGRTLMASMRTALSMIGFGFTIYKFLNGLHEAGGIHLRRPDEPRRLGVFLVALGTGSLLVGILEYVRTLGRVAGRRPRLRSTFYVACALVALGFWVLAGLIRPPGPS